jgi:uncharacterized protein (DUF2141 family)
MIALAAFILASSNLRSTPELGIAAGSCRQPEPGPAVLIAVKGLKDRSGRLRAELYPPNDEDFLADDNILIEQHKTFARVDQAIPPSGPVSLCIRVPAPGKYTLSLLHDRDANHKFSMFSDGIGFAGDPKLGWSKPHAASATVEAGAGITNIMITLNYRHGLSMRPLERP